MLSSSDKSAMKHASVESLQKCLTVASWNGHQTAADKSKRDTRTVGSMDNQFNLPTRKTERYKISSDASGLVLDLMIR